MKKLILLAIIIFVAIFAYYYYFGNATSNHRISLFNREKTMGLTSTAFTNNSEIPSQYTCDGQDINPPLNFSNVSANAKSLVLTLEDPNAPTGTFTHWVAYNIEPLANGIDENSQAQGELDGINDFGTQGYAGPCPEFGEHHYIFTLYSLGDYLTLEKGITKKELLSKIQNITLQTAVLTGRYKKQ